MQHVMVRYTVKKEKLEQAKKEISAFIEGVRRNEPYTAYDVFQEGECSFVHLMGFRDERSRTLHREAAYTNRFEDFLFPSCVSEPTFTELKLFRSARAEHGRKW